MSYKHERVTEALAGLVALEELGIYITLDHEAQMKLVRLASGALIAQNETLDDKAKRAAVEWSFTNEQGQTVVRKIQAIKYLRDAVPGLGLKEAKEAIERAMVEIEAISASAASAGFNG